MKFSFTARAKFDGSHSPSAEQPLVSWGRIFAVATVLLMTKVLWGYWERDLSYGDTSYYFQNAAIWHDSKAVNLVWSPLYTSYYGYWLSVSENAVVATILHRIGLILVSTGLVAWLAFRTLPKIFALFLVSWWIALPIHYDTLYEVHMFGTLPVIVLALIAHGAGDKWRMPLMLGTAIGATALIRNEFILGVGIFLLISTYELVRYWRTHAVREMRASVFRHLAVLLLVGLSIAFFYSASYIKGQDISKISGPKHTLNMCQVYAFGYQQRNPEWSASPWTDCSSLMQQKFGMGQPSLQQMIMANPKEVAEHFWWNLSLSQAGLEVLLFNATSSTVNPDYTPVPIVRVIPSVLLVLSLFIVAAGTVVVYRGDPIQYSGTRSNIAKLAPILFTVALISFAVILTQRPRPSYLLGAGILFIWLTLAYAAALVSKWKIAHNNLAFLITALLLLLIVPSYKNLSLPSKTSSIKSIYAATFAYHSKICAQPGKIAIARYVTEISNYVCPPHLVSGVRKYGPPVISIASMGKDATLNLSDFGKALDTTGVTTLIVDPSLIQKHPTLRDCAAIRDDLLKRGWEQLSYSAQQNKECIAVFTKDRGTN